MKEKLAPAGPEPSASCLAGHGCRGEQRGKRKPKRAPLITQPPAPSNPGPGKQGEAGDVTLKGGSKVKRQSRPGQQRAEGWGRGNQRDRNNRAGLSSATT